MKKLLAFVAFGAGLFVAVPLPAQAQYNGGPRIIHVPQPEQRQIARNPGPVARSNEAAPTDTDEIAAVPSVNRRGGVPRIRKPQLERRRAFAPSPLPSEPGRTMLSTPLPVEGPSPIRPLPRWRDGDKVGVTPGRQVTGGLRDETTAPVLK